jgi:hypothetical protein
MNLGSILPCSLLMDIGRVRAIRVGVRIFHFWQK